MLTADFLIYPLSIAIKNRYSNLNLNIKNWKFRQGYQKQDTMEMEMH